MVEFRFESGSDRRERRSELVGRVCAEGPLTADERFESLSCRREGDRRCCEFGYPTGWNGDSEVSGSKLFSGVSQSLDRAGEVVRNEPSLSGCDRDC